MNALDFICIVLILIFLFCFVKSRFLKKTYDDPLIERIKFDLLLVHPKAKELNYFASNESLTENKKDMYLCLKDENGQYYPYNMLMYVALHELAHAVSKSVDDAHTGEEFNRNFDILLERATQLGLYNPNEPLLNNYCGVSA
jgi:hypothetical protein